MKLPAILKADTASKLASARDAAASAEARLGQLAAERTAALGGDDIDAVRQADRKIDAARGELVAHQDRIVVLEARHVGEQRAQRMREKEAYIVAIEKLAADRDAMGDELEAAFKNVSTIFMRLGENRKAILAAWRSDLVPPSKSNLMFISELLYTKALPKDPTRLAEFTKGLGETIRSGTAADLKYMRDAPLPVTRRKEAA